VDPKEFLLYYTAIFFVAALLIMRKKPRKGMLLKLRGRAGTKQAPGRNYSDLAKEFRLEGTQPPAHVTHIPVERPLNVVFNYNGESWDAYEVLGLPAGSSLESVERAFQESLQRVDSGARPLYASGPRGHPGAVGILQNFKGFLSFPGV
jgi:hypothetical protein